MTQLPASKFLLVSLRCIHAMMSTVETALDEVLTVVRAEDLLWQQTMEVIKVQRVARRSLNALINEFIDNA